jgi:hypothetical protein
MPVDSEQLGSVYQSNSISAVQHRVSRWKVADNAPDYPYPRTVCRPLQKDVNGKCVADRQRILDLT